MTTPTILILAGKRDGTPGALADLPAVQALKADGRLTVSVARDTLVQSIEAAVAEPAMRWPLLITTGDNVLITPEALRDVHRFGEEQGAGALLCLAHKPDVLAAHPEGQRNFYRFRDAEIANCNTYWLRDAGTLKATEAFREGGQFMKNRDRIARAFGYLNLAAFALGLLSVNRAMARISRRMGVNIRAYRFTDGAYAIDVDNERTYKVCEQLLAIRKP